MGFIHIYCHFQLISTYFKHIYLALLIFTSICTYFHGNSICLMYLDPKILVRLLRSVYFNRVVYFYIFTATYNLFLPILNIFMHIPNYFHVYLYLYLTYLDIFSCIFIPIFMYISTYFYIFLLISTYLLLFSTYL